MIRNFLYTLMMLFFSLINSAYAQQTSAKIINHREWVTGPLALQYNLNSEQEDTTRIVNKPKLLSKLKQFVHLEPIISSIKTTYNAKAVITKISSSFLTEFEGFSSQAEPLLFSIHRQTCIDDIDPAAPSPFTSCVHTEDTILVDNMQVLDIKPIKLDACNLPPGKYVASTEMFVTQISPHSNPQISFLTMGQGIPFTVQQQ